MERIFLLQPYDSSSIIITICAILLFIISLIIILIILRKHSGNKILIFGEGTMVLVLLSTIVVSLAYAPKSLNITKDALVLESFLFSTQIPFSEILDVTFAMEDDFVDTYRIFGIGGFLGYYGKYRSKKIHSFEMFATSQKNALFIRTKEKYVVVTPRNADLFIYILRKEMHR